MRAGLVMKTRGTAIISDINIDGGRPVACDATQALPCKVDKKKLCMTLTAPVVRLPQSLAALGLTVEAPGRVVFHYKPSGAQVGEVLAAVAAAGLTIRDVSNEETDLENIFVRRDWSGTVS